MTPKDLAHNAISRARNSTLNDLERLEFIYELPTMNTNTDLVDSFLEHCFYNLASLINVYRKGSNARLERKIIKGNDRFYLVTQDPSHLFYMNNFSAVKLHSIPDDFDEILSEFSIALKERNAIVEEIISEYWVTRKAGDIARTTIDILLKDVLAKSEYKLRIFCGNDSQWRCILQSDMKEKCITFFSTPDKIFDDIRRIVGE